MLIDGDKVAEDRWLSFIFENALRRRQQAIAYSRISRRISRGGPLQATARQGPVELRYVDLDDHVELFAVPR